MHQLAKLQTAQISQLRRALRRGRIAERARCRWHGQRAQQALQARGVVGAADRDRLAVGQVPRRIAIAGQQRNDGLAALFCVEVFQPYPFAGVGGRGYQADEGVGALDSFGNRRQPYLAAGDVAGVEPAGVAGPPQIGDQTVGDLPVATRVADEDNLVTRAGLVGDRWRETWRGCGCGGRCCGEVGAGETAPVQLFDQRPERSLLFVSRSAADRLEEKRECMTRPSIAVVKQTAHASDDEICRGAALRNRVVHVRMLGVKGEGQPGVTPVFAHERSEQIGGLFADVHSLVVSPERTRCAHIRHVMPTPLAW